MATFPVKYINNDMRGAPKLSGTAGALIAVFDAFLVTGFGLVTAQSVTVAGGIATAMLNAGDTFAEYCVVLVAGATPDALNGEARVLTASNTSITWATTAPDGVATGSITIKVAPVGQWEKVFSGTNKAVYRCTDVQGSRFFLWVDDSGTTSARVRGFENMADVGTGSGAFPAEAHISGGGWILKSVSANSNAVRYDLMADSRRVYWAIGAGSASSAANMSSPLRGFGDMLPLRPGGDAYAVALSCQSAFDTTGYFGFGAFNSSSRSGASGVYFARGPSGLGSAVQAAVIGYSGTRDALSGKDGLMGAFPSSIDGELKYSKCFLTPGDGSNTPRADVPGVLHIPQSDVSISIGARDIIAGSGAMAGRRLLALLASTASATDLRTSCGVYLVDITGPWG